RFRASRVPSRAQSGEWDGRLGQTVVFGIYAQPATTPTPTPPAPAPTPVTPLLAAPSLLQPPNGAVGTHKQIGTPRWRTVHGAVSYNLYESEVSASTGPGGAAVAGPCPGARTHTNDLGTVSHPLGRLYLLLVCRRRGRVWSSGNLECLEDGRLHRMSRAGGELRVISGKGCKEGLTSLAPGARASPRPGVR